MWHKVAKVSDLAEGHGQSLEIAGQPIALFRVKNKFYALHDLCLHRGGALVEGHIEGHTLACPWHGWEFDVRDGKCHTMPDSKQKTYPIKVEKDDLYVQI